jgi:hypothetical protein
MLGFFGQFKGILDNFHIFYTIVVQLAYFFNPCLGITETYNNDLSSSLNLLKELSHVSNIGLSSL